MKYVVGLSGGLDSAVLLAALLDQGHEVQAMGFSYGSKHNEYENMAAIDLAAFYNIPFFLTNIAEAFKHFKSNLLKKGDAIPEGHYQEESMRMTVVPGRNLILISILAGFAESIGSEAVAIGAHAGDHFIYPDCRVEFITAARKAVERSSDGRVTLKAPFSDHNKDWIVALGHRLRVPFAKTRTCYKDQKIACGKCGSCQERLEAFCVSGIVDPLDYETRQLIPHAT